MVFQIWKYQPVDHWHHYNCMVDRNKCGGTPPGRHKVKLYWRHRAVHFMIPMRALAFLGELVFILYVNSNKKQAAHTHSNTRPLCGSMKMKINGNNRRKCLNTLKFNRVVYLYYGIESFSHTVSCWPKNNTRSIGVSGKMEVTGTRVI